MGIIIQNTKELLHSANEIYNKERFDNPNKLPNLFLANGQFGGCVDSFGQTTVQSGGTLSFFWHKLHVEVPEGHEIEARLPLLLYDLIFTVDGKIIPLNAETVNEYSQELDLLTATVTTKYVLIDDNTPVARVVFKQFVSLSETFLSQFSLTVEPIGTHVTVRYRLNMLDECISHRGKIAHYPRTICEISGKPVLCSTTSRGNAWATVISREANTEIVNENKLEIELSFKTKKTVDFSLILVSSRSPYTTEQAIALTLDSSPEIHKAKHENAWNNFWGKSMLSLGNEQLENIWLRFLYTMRCSESDTPSVPLSPGGLASTGLWPFEFPQDYLWMYESYFISNHLEMANGTARYWNTILEDVRSFTKNEIRTVGVFFPWTPSSFDLKEIKRPTMDPPYAWQLHNAAYPVRMIQLYWQYTGDDKYLYEMLPVIEGVAEFYCGISTKNLETGKYEIHFKPCMGQDEFGGFNCDNYLCCMLSACYTMHVVEEVYQKLGKTLPEIWQDILNNGYCFDKLSVTGRFATYEGGPTPNPSQKHPSQLNAIAALPLPEIYKTEAFDETHKSRYDISMQSHENFWSGWSLGTFLISSVRMRKTDRVSEDFKHLLSLASADKSQTDPGFLQLFETGGYTNGASYFHTAMAMVVSAITELCVQCYDGECTIFPVLPDCLISPVSFEGLLTPFGYTVSGTISDGCAELLIHVSKKTTKVSLILGSPCTGRYAIYNSNDEIVATIENNKATFNAQCGDYIVKRI